MNHPADLLEARCQACDKTTPPLSRDDAELMLQRQLPHWSLSDDGQAISRDFRFKTFDDSIAFVNALAWVAKREDHHPDLNVGYGYCQVRYSTHVIGGLSMNDFICARKIDQLLN